ncbi:Opsin-3 [Liparis tanakae]|uniref:Opsin-3 n=1 Tax=Liparis tanakae TaxID=230148 RepID=A0A4Z2ITZ0_9TELE|nr:Opsin-3 [Liparis tanakae]
MIVSNVSLSGCAGVNSALCAAAAGEGHLRGGSDRSTLTPTGNLVVAVCLGIIGTLGLMNNLLVLVLFCRFKILRSPINLLLINISISDLLVCVLGTPFSFAASTQGRWLIGEGGCVWYGFANSLFGIVSLISLAVLSYERYSTMVAPTEADSSNYQKVYLGITLSWVYSLIWTVPPLFGWSHYGPEGPGTTCSVDWTAKTANSVSYIICLFVFCLIVPFLVIVYCYGKLLCAIRQLLQRQRTGKRTDRARQYRTFSAATLKTPRCGGEGGKRWGRDGDEMEKVEVSSVGTHSGWEEGDSECLYSDSAERSGLLLREAL